MQIIDYTTNNPYIGNTIQMAKYTEVRAWTSKPIPKCYASIIAYTHHKLNINWADLYRHATNTKS